MNTTQRKRLLKLADFIVERVPKKRFNMARYGTMLGELDRQPCGTAGCALGWCTVLFRRIGCTADSQSGLPAYKDLMGYGVGVELFGLTYEQSEELFSGTKSGQSAKQVRRDILRFVAQLDKKKAGVFFLLAGAVLS